MCVFVCVCVRACVRACFFKVIFSGVVKGPKGEPPLGSPCIVTDPGPIGVHVVALQFSPIIPNEGPEAKWF